MTNKHLHADVHFHPDDNVYFDRSLDEHDDRRGGDVGCGWCQGAVCVGVVDDPPHLPGDAHPGCRRAHHGPAIICKNEIHLISAHLILFRTPLLQNLVHRFLVTAVLIWLPCCPLSLLHTLGQPRTFPDSQNMN